MKIKHFILILVNSAVFLTAGSAMAEKCSFGGFGTWNTIKTTCTALEFEAFLGAKAGTKYRLICQVQAGGTEQNATVTGKLNLTQKSSEPVDYKIMTAAKGPQPSAEFVVGMDGNINFILTDVRFNNTKESTVGINCVKQ